MNEQKPHPTDVVDDEWVFVVPYLTLMPEDAPQRGCPLREGFNGLRDVMCAVQTNQTRQSKDY